MLIKMLTKVFGREAKEPQICVGIVTAAINRAEYGGLGGIDTASYVLLETASGKRDVKMSTTSPAKKPEEFDVYARDVIKWQHGVKRLEDIEAYLEMKSDAPQKLGYDLVGTYDMEHGVAGSDLPAQLHYKLYEHPESGERRITVDMSNPINHWTLSFYKNFAQRWLDHQLQNNDIQHILDGNKAAPAPAMEQNDDTVVYVDFSNNAPRPVR